MTATRRWSVVALLAVLAAVPVSAAKAPAKGRKAGAAPAAARDTSRVLVRIAGEPVTADMVRQRLEEIPEGMRATYSTPEGRQQLLERMVEERIWLLTATRAGVAQRPRIVQQLEQQRRDLLIRTWLQEAMAANPAPADSEARVYYDAHQADYAVPATVTVRHIQTRTEAEAKRALTQARAKGADFAALAKKLSADTLTRSSGGLLGTVTREGMFGPIGAQPALAESAFALREGAVGGPYRTDRGWHVLQVDSRRDASTRPFDQVRPLIMRQLSGQRSQEFYRRLLEDARRDLQVTTDSTAVRDFVSQKKSARDLFQEAQEAGPANERLALYRRLVQEYPDADVAPQAQFMLGFIQSEEFKNHDEAEKEFRALLRRYPRSELAASAQWMIEHMRTEDVPPMLRLEADSARVGAPADTVHHRAVGDSGKP
jgi:parvulin-like peptidyl-prolyl isomerase